MYVQTAIFLQKCTTYTNYTTYLQRFTKEVHTMYDYILYNTFCFVGKEVPDFGNCQSMSSFLKRALRLEGPQLTQRTITIKKNVRESLGMRIGGGIGSNEGDTPIYVANIHPHGCIGKSKQLKVLTFKCAQMSVALCY